VLLMIVFTYLAMAAAAVAHRLRGGAVALNDEAGITIVEWMVMGIVAVAAMVAIRLGMLDLAGRIITHIGNELGI
jgi:hypothetical protein